MRNSGIKYLKIIWRNIIKIIYIFLALDKKKNHSVCYGIRVLISVIHIRQYSVT